jgi:hypothetical protein
VQLQEICNSLGAEGVTSLVLKSFLQIQKLLALKAFYKFKIFWRLTAKNVLIQYKIKGKVKKNYEYLPDSFLTQDGF